MKHNAPTLWPARSGIHRQSGFLSVAVVALVLALLSVIPGRVLAQYKPMENHAIELFRRSAKAAALATQTISCDFTQEKNMSMISEQIVSGGKFYLKKEKMLRWEYLRPYTYVIVMKNDQVSVKDENRINRFSVQSNKVFAEINRVILGSLQGTLFNDDKNFKPSFFENASAYIVRLQTLTPKLKESLAEIVIWFDRGDYSVTKLEMVEAGGDLTRITFTNRKINQPVPDEKFVLD